MIDTENNDRVYILYSGRDDNTIRIKNTIKEAIEKNTELPKPFDYQDRSPMDNVDSRHNRMDILIQSIRAGSFIIIHLDENYLKSIYCLDELNILGQQNNEFFERKLVCVVHSEKLYKQIHQRFQAGIDEIIENIGKEIESFEKENNLTTEEQEELDGYKASIRRFFNALKDYRYKAVVCTKDEHIKNVLDDIQNISIDLQKHIKKLKKDRWIKKWVYVLLVVVSILGLLGLAGLGLYQIYINLQDHQDIKKNIYKETNKIRDEIEKARKHYEKTLEVLQGKKNNIDPQTFNKEVRSKIETAKEYQHDRKFSKSIEIYSDILKNKGLLTEENRIAIYKEIINCVRESKLYDDMEKYTNTLIGFIRANDAKKYKSSLAWAFMQKGQIYYYKNNSKNAIKYFKKAQDEYTDEEDKAWALSWLGYTYYSKKSDYAYASKIFKKSLQKYLDQNISQDERVAYLYSRIGNSKGRLGNFNDAIENTNKAIAIYEQINKNNKYNSDIAWCYNILGLIYDKKPDPDPSIALENYTKACKLGNAWGCHNVGVFYRDGRGAGKNLSSALQYYNRSCELKLGQACSESGYIYESNSSIENYMDLALDKYEQACRLQDSWACNKLGNLYRNRTYWQIPQDYQKAKKYYTQACDNNYSSACVGIGLMYEREEGGDANQTVALQYYKKACKLKNAWGCYDAGLNYQYGRGTEKNDGLVIKYFLKARKLGHPSAAHRLSILINYGNKPIEIEKKIDINKRLCQEGTPLSCSWLGDYFKVKNPEKSKYFYKKAIEIFSNKCKNGDNEACNRLASIYYYGDYGHKDMENFLKIADKNCNHNLAVSCALISIYYINNSKDANTIKKYQDKAYNNCKGENCWECGLYFESNDKTSKHALRFYEKACRDSVKSACLAIAESYRDGIGVNRDIEKAIEYLFPLAKKDFLDAREALADIYYDMEDSYKTEAFKWYKLAAQKDQGWSEYRLGYMYEYAEGTPRDINKSIYWYKKSIKDGVFDGAENLADIYCNREDYNLAFHYYKITVDNNVSDRNYELGCMYEHGNGINKDRHLAFLHYEKSAKNGNSASQCKLAKAYKNGDLVGADVNKSKYWLRLFNENNDTEKGKCVLDSVCEDYDESLQNIIQSNQESMLQIKKLRKEIDKMIISTEIINPSEN